uniref:Reprolysin n=1 Tax=Rhipicephalus appendiculatus TaxID=34631 RepID=A0A131YWB8_RHIAP
MVSITHNGLELDGVVGPRHRIAPAPEMERSEEGHVAHVIQEIEQQPNDMFDALIPNRTDKAALLAERQYNYYQRVPAEVTVEVFVISDQIHQRRFTQTQHLLGYMCVMINSANLRLQDTNAPRIKLLLIGLERVQSAQDEPYLKGDDKYMDDTATITVLVEYIKTRKHLYGDPDAVYLATGRDMYAMDSGVPDTRRKGLAFVAGVCTELFVAIGEDNAGSYDGMHALTHEVAHLLGAAHDGDEPKTNIVPGHPGALACPFSQGYIMSYLNTGPNYHRFSSCSVVQMRYVMRLRGPLCWRVKSQGHKVDGYYPGMLVTPQNICKYKFPREQSVTADTSLAVLKRCKVRCMYSKLRNLYGRVYNFPVQVEFEAPDHARCGNRTVCIRGICGLK